MEVREGGGTREEKRERFTGAEKNTERRKKWERESEKETEKREKTDR